MNNQIAFLIFLLLFTARILCTETAKFDLELIDSKARKNAVVVTCFSGSTLPTLDSVEFEIFPDFGFYRLRVVSPDGSQPWLIMRTSKKKISDAESALAELRDCILLTSSGLVMSDLQKATISCKRNKKYSFATVTVGYDAFGNPTNRRVIFSPDVLVENWLVEDNEWRSFTVQVPRQIEGTPESSKEMER